MTHIKTSREKNPRGSLAGAPYGIYGQNDDGFEY